MNRYSDGNLVMGPLVLPASSLGMLNNNNKLIFSYTLCVVHKLGRPGYTALCLIVYTEYTALSVKYTASTQGSYTQH